VKKRRNGVVFARVAAMRRQLASSLTNEMALLIHGSAADFIVNADIIFTPHSPLRTGWDVLMIVLTIYCCFQVRSRRGAEATAPLGQTLLCARYVTWVGTMGRSVQGGAERLVACVGDHSRAAVLFRHPRRFQNGTLLNGRVHAARLSCFRVSATCRIHCGARPLSFPMPVHLDIGKWTRETPFSPTENYAAERKLLRRVQYADAQGFFKQGVLVLDWRVIARRYASTWFVPDVVAVFPWEVAASPLRFTLHRARLLLRIASRTSPHKASPRRSIAHRVLAL
jgi:hypothetical protein